MSRGAGGELAGIGGAEVEEGGGGFGDGVDGGAAGDLSDVESGARRTGSWSAIEPGEGVAEDQNGVGGAGIGPGMAAGAGDGEAEAAAAECAGDDGAGAAAFERDGGGDAVAIGAVEEEVAHAAQVALALLAYVGGEEDGTGGVISA